MELTGEIPSWLGNMNNLNTLYLSDNELSGEIPQSICNLNIDFEDESKFRIQNNNLCQPYPPCISPGNWNTDPQDQSNCP